MSSWKTNYVGSTAIIRTEQNDSDWASSLREGASHGLNAAGQREHEPTQSELVLCKLLLTPLCGLSTFGKVVQENLFPHILKVP